MLNMQPSFSKTNSVNKVSKISQPFDNFLVDSNSVNNHRVDSYQVDSYQVDSYRVNSFLAPKGHPQRAAIESFIASGYQKSYQAIIKHFMPSLLTITDGNKQAALGIRFAGEQFFIEQYTKCPVEQLQFFTSASVQANQIAEIGNLYANNPRFTIQLFLLMSVSLFINDIKYIAFAGTKKVRRLLKRTGIELHEVCSASESDLEGKSNIWGTYYQAEPEVVAIELEQVMKVIANNTSYQQQFENLTNEIADLSSQLKLQIRASLKGNKYVK